MESTKQIRIYAKDAKHLVLTNRRKKLENILEGLAPIYALIDKAIAEDVMYVDVPHEVLLTQEGIELLTSDGYSVQPKHHMDSNRRMVTRIGFDA